MIQSNYEHVGAGRREAVLAALLEATQRLHGPDVARAIEEALGTAARSVEAGSARLFRIVNGAGGERCIQRCVAWGVDPSASGAEAVLDAATLAEYSTLRQGKPVCTRTDRAPEAHASSLRAHGIAAVLSCPIVTDDGLWGGVQFVQYAPPEMDWSYDEARLLHPLAEHLAALLQARGTEEALPGRRSPHSQRGEAPGTADPQALRLQRRVRAERALVEASKLLVSTEPFAMDELLRIVGKATGADYAYLVTIRPEEGHGPSPLASQSASTQAPIELDEYAHYEWYASRSARARRPAVGLAGEPASPDGATFAVPILSSENLLFGYLGIDFEDGASPLGDEDVRVLNVLGDMLCTYLQRQIADRALRKSERRYRHFVATISEAIWRIDFDPPVAVDQPAETQVEAVLQQGVIAECNDELARLFGGERAEHMIGWRVARLAEFTGHRLVHDAVEAGFQLQNREHVVYDERREPRHFIVNTSGVVEDGGLISIWGSTTEVTERVQLERRMVAALEQQQQRIGRDLHDSVGQLLTGVRMLAQNLEERHFRNGAPGAEQVRKIINYAEQAAKHVSDLQRGLMPVQMERAGLAQALKELASNTDVLPGVDCIYVVDGVTDVRDQEKKLQLYRIAQEATNNALKHARPSYIKIALKTDGDKVILEVEDDGVGFEMTQADRESLGLHSMYYRARSINGTLRVHSAPGSGTTVRCEVARTEVAGGAGDPA